MELLPHDRREVLIELRQRLHRCAERSGEEVRTARTMADVLAATGPDELVTGLGGHGLAAVYEGQRPGPTVLVRADMDALPLPDTPGLPHASETADTAHKCGHDGHMTMLTGVAQQLGDQRPACGRAVLLFQPAEETGAGAARVLADPRFTPLRPDRVLALHNLPGYPLGAVVLRREGFASASRGLIVALEGASSHAAEPAAGRTPAPAAAALVQALAAAPQHRTALHEAAQVTVVGVEVGGPAFGTSPGRGRVMATLRTHHEPVMERLAEHSEHVCRAIAAAHDLQCSLDWTEVFPAVRNHARTVDRVAAQADALGLTTIWPDVPFPWSEDFGHFTSEFPGALFGLGAGEAQPALHHPEYDFPDALIPTGVAMLARALEDLQEAGDE